jgi:adenylyltransferase/sulfurtransferase
MTDTDLRYSRHIALPGFGAQGQDRIASSSALIIGLGGLGSPVTIYLAAAGVGTLVINDFDRVDLSNLQRQILYRDRDVDMQKTEAAAAMLLEINPDTKIKTVGVRLTGDALEKQIADVDVVIDGSDNFGTRFAVNEACVKTKTPLISGAAIRYEGQLMVLRPDIDDRPCYRCVFDESDETIEDCRGNGVLSPVVGVIGSSMAVEALKLLAAISPAEGIELHLYDARSGHWRTVSIKRDDACPACSG